MEMEEPVNVSKLKSFSCMVNQLYKYIPQLAEIDKPLRDLLSKKKAAFKTLKQN